MAIRRRISIVAATERVVIIRPVAHDARRAVCHVCAVRGLMLTPVEAARLLHESQRRIYQLLEAGQLHFMETEDELLICHASLQRAIGARY
jgi:hypothetical protein